MNAQYLIAFLVLCILFVCTFILMKYMRNIMLFNSIFVGLIFIPYLIMVIYIFKTDDDPTRWNFFNALPTANISPFMFTFIPIIVVLPKQVKERLLSIVALLSVGMFLSTALGCVGNAMRNYKFHFHFMLDYISHFSFSLFGVYLIRTKQVVLNLKNSIVSCLILLCVPTLMLIINLIFDTAFFGLSLNGKHNIYNLVLGDNSYISALIYYVGVVVVLSLGYLVSKILDKKLRVLDIK